MKEKKVILVDIIVLAVFCAAVAFAIVSLCTGYLKITVDGISTTYKLMELAEEEAIYRAAVGLTITALVIAPVVVVMRILFILIKNEVFEIITFVTGAVCGLCLIISIILAFFSGNTEFVKIMKDLGAVRGYAVGFYLTFASCGCLGISFVVGYILDAVSGRIETWD